MRNLFLFTLVLTPTVALADPPVDPDAPLATLLDAQLGHRGGLTASEVARRAEDDSPSVRAALADVRAASASTEVSTLAYIPRTTVSARYTRLSHVEQSQDIPIEIPEVQNQWTAELSLDVPLSDYLLRLPHERDAALRTEEAAGHSLAATRRSVGSNAKLVYWNWVRARLAVVVTEQAKAQSQAHLGDTRAMHEVGSASRADVLRAESAVASADLALARARGSEARLADQLRTVARLPGNRPLVIGDSLDLNETAGTQQASNARLLADAYQTRPELRSMALLAAAERSRSTAIRSAAYPRLDGVATQTYANPNQRIFPQRADFDHTWQAGVNITWGVSGIASALASSRASEARADAMDEDQLALRDAIRQDVIDAAESVREADTSLGTTAQGLVAAEESHRVRRELFRAGRATAAEMVDAETELTRARLDAVQARIDRRVAEVRLAEAVGR